MPNRLEAAFDRLSTRMRSHAGISVTYQRGALALSADAVQARSSQPIEDLGAGMMLTGRFEDFLILVTDDIWDQLTKPKRGDIIKYTRNVDVGDGTLETTRTFRVVSPPGENCFETVDYDHAYRIHTEEIKAET